jgi:hypothetical protein
VSGSGSLAPEKPASEQAFHCAAHSAFRGLQSVSSADVLRNPPVGKDDRTPFQDTENGYL